jgi:hypothetical protein
LAQPTALAGFHCVGSYDMSASMSPYVTDLRGPYHDLERFRARRLGAGSSLLGPVSSLICDADRTLGQVSFRVPVNVFILVSGGLRAAVQRFADRPTTSLQSKASTTQT